MKYYIDAEFNEDFHKPLFGKKRHFIDLISIGIVCEDGRTYYAISKDFSLKKAWDKCDIIHDHGKPQGLADKKLYWLRDNVLKSIYDELLKDRLGIGFFENEPMDYIKMQYLISEYGKTNQQIAKEILEFCRPNSAKAISVGVDIVIEPIDFPKFYGYYSDYDWVLFCSLFGTMQQLPKGFPMYCRDLIQETESVLSKKGLAYYDFLKHPNYPSKTDEHNALADAKWNQKLHNFINSL